MQDKLKAARNAGKLKAARNAGKLKAARDAGKLKPYDLTQAQVGDKIDLPFTTPCEVLAIHNGVVVIGLVEGTAVFPYPQNTPLVDHRLCHLPIA